jgi:hypothetical protein
VAVSIRIKKKNLLEFILYYIIKLMSIESTNIENILEKSAVTDISTGHPQIRTFYGRDCRNDVLIRKYGLFTDEQNKQWFIRKKHLLSADAFVVPPGLEPGTP